MPTIVRIKDDESVVSSAGFLERSEDFADGVV